MSNLKVWVYVKKKAHRFFRPFPLSHRRKWLPPPLRKLSQSKVDKSTSAIPVSSNDRPGLKKNVSEKRFKLPTTGGVEQVWPSRTASVSISTCASAVASMRVSASSSDADLDTQPEIQHDAEEEEEGEVEQNSELEEDLIAEPDDDTETVPLSEQNGADDVEDELELPPPMKPITEPILVGTANGSSGSTIPAAEGCGKSRVSSTPFSFSFSITAIRITLSNKIQHFFSILQYTIAVSL